MSVWRSSVLLIGGLSASRADSVFLKSVANGKYIGLGLDGVVLAAKSPTTDSAETFERIYPGNGYFVLKTGSTGAYVSFGDQQQASAGAATPHDAALFTASAPRPADRAISLRVRSTGRYVAADLSQDGLLAANYANASADQAWFTMESAGATQPSISMDLGDPRQTITGFGAAVAYYGNWLTSHPNKQDIYAALFGADNGLGASILRLQNVYRYQSNANFDPDAAEIVQQAAAQRNGVPIPIEMSSWSPPAALKSNNREDCKGTKNCTLATKNGAFDYDGFAQFWADAIAAYSNAGIHPDWISLQNEPDIITDYASCRFYPAETIDSGIQYAGYGKALNAVAMRLSLMNAPPKIIGPEVLGVGYNNLPNFMGQLDSSQLDVIAHHLYHGGSETAPDTFNPAFESIQANYSSKLRFQTEYYRGTGLQTAWIIHNSLVVEEVSAYLAWGAIWPDTGNLIDIEFPWDRNQWTTVRGWKANDQYYALEHYSRFIRPGFRRLPALTNQPDLRVSAFVSPDGGRVVFVAINTGMSDSSIGLDMEGIATSALYRTGFADTAERFAAVGGLDSAGMFLIGPQSAVTVVVDLAN